MTEDYIKGLNFFGAAFVVAIVAVFIWNVVDLKGRMDMRSDVATAVESGYTVYYNGAEIDGTKVNLDRYTADLNDEDKEVYLSDKVTVRTKYSYVPYVQVPMVH